MKRVLAAVLATAVVAALWTASPAVADTAPVPPVTQTTVSADALPTVQINGIVRDQVIVGNRVYVTGEFTQARPAGSAAGTNQTARSNILAYDLTTGALITSWAPTLNAAGQAIAASSDGTRIFVGGSFTSVSGVTRNRIVALDATTGAVLAWNPSANSRVGAIAVSGNTVYFGGIFGQVGNSTRIRLAAVDATTGALTSWAPTADAEPLALVAPAGSGSIVVGGKFQNLNGQPWYGMGALDATTGANKPWSIVDTVRNAGANAAIYSLGTDGAQVYGSGYTFGDGGNLEGTFAARASDGAMVYVTGCRGDTYDAQPVNGVLYYVGHPHDCSSIGGNPQTDPWTFQHAYAQTTTQGSNNAVNQGGTFNGAPAPELLHWLPTFDTGNYSGSNQAAWTVTGNSDYVVMGGEFPKVNGTAQQGLVRFAVRSKAPNTQGPQGGADLTPTLLSLVPGRVRVSFPASWDRDNRRLTYEILRGTPLASATVVATFTADSTWWNRPIQSWTDTSVAAGSNQTYRVRVKDPLGNTVLFNPATVAVAAGDASTSPYVAKVTADGASDLWRMNEASGTKAYDWIGAEDLTLDASATRGTAGASPNETGTTSTTFPGTATVPATSPSAKDGPQTFSQELWFKTTTTSGGKLLGFGNSNTGDSGGYDRHVYMQNDGRVVFGVYPGGVQTVTSPTALNDGQWHQVATSLGSDGMTLYVDGKRVGRNTAATSAQVYSGYWRIGGDNLNGWPNQPTSSRFAGSIQDVSIYPSPLSLTQVQQHYEATGRSLNLPTRPTDAYGAAVWDAQPSLFWRLDEKTGSQALDRATNNANSGTYSSGVVLNDPASPAQSAGSAIRLPGTSEQTLVATTAVDNPTSYSLEAWFRTTSTDGGRIIGFGNSGSAGRSSNYDRFVQMFSDGRLRYGIYDGNTRVADTATSYNDGAWHHVVATQSPTTAQKLYVDGVLVASGGGTSPQNYTGYWRLGTDNEWGGSNTDNLAGSIDEVAVYDSVLSDATVNQHWNLGKPVPPNQAPTAAFSSTPANLTAAFDGSASADPDGTIASYAWQFGDGSTGTGATPSHPYAAPGTYTVVLTVTDDKGATGTVTHDVTVTAPPNQAPTASFTSSSAKLKASFDGTASSDPDGTVASYAWQFGDGSTGTGATPQHTYAAAGSYPVVLTVTDDKGATGTVTKNVTVTGNVAPTAAFTSTCTELACSFTGAASADSDGTVASYAWTFGDGGTATGATPSHTYASAGTRTVTLTVTDDDGATGTVSQTVTVAKANNPPTASIASTCTDLSCSFDGSGSTDSDGTVASYAWTFGDGGTATGATPAAHVYAAAGSYTATLTVTDDAGATGTASKVVTVTAPNQPPVAAFTKSCTELACTFDASGTTDADGSVVSYAWTFGDGATGTGVTPSHTYAAGGTYTVTLTATDDKGATNSVSTTVSPAVAVNQPPTAAFTPTCSAATCSFDSAASSDPDGSIVTRTWDFGDGQTLTGATVQHTYAAGGTYQVKLTVTDDKGGTGTVTKPVTVTTPPPNQPPTAAFTATCTALVCNVDGSTSSDPDGGITGYAWAFGDGGSATGATAAHTYAAAGSYTVTLTVTDTSGATASTTRQVTVSGAPATGTTLATDAFGRVVNGGFGTADLGGAWGLTAGGTTVSVADGSGKVSVPAGKAATLRLGSVSGASTDVTHLFWTETVPTGGGLYDGTIVRGTSAGDYRARIRIQSTGVVTAGFVLFSAGAETTIGSQVNLSGLTYTAGTKLRIRAQAEGASPTTLRMKVWVDGTTEPNAWTLTTTDATAGLQTAGSVGFYPYLSGSATAAVVARYDDLSVRTIGAAPANQAPTASFTTSCTGLVCSVNGSGSSDPDGTVVSYAWNYGDGALGAGATASHTYAAGGTYTVTLTVTDNSGATATTTRSVTVTAPANQPPVAAFTNSCAALACSFDGTGSSDPDGSVTSYSWTFGDGTTATGATPSRTYAAAGSYPVVLTVTDDKGATSTVSRTITVTAANVLAADAFGRTVASGLGTADTGGAWTLSAPGSTVAVADGVGRMSVPAGRTVKARIGSVASTSTDVVHTVSMDTVPDGGGAYLGTTARSTATGDYRARLRVTPDGVVTASLSRVVSGTETVISSQVVSGLTYTAGASLSVRVQATGTSPTTLRMKVWATGTTEPAAWRLSVTDSTSGLQSAGSVGLDPYLSGSSMVPVVIRYDELKATVP